MKEKSDPPTNRKCWEKRIKAKKSAPKNVKSLGVVLYVVKIVASYNAWNIFSVCPIWRESSSLFRKKSTYPTERVCFEIFSNFMGPNQKFGKQPSILHWTFWQKHIRTKVFIEPGTGLSNVQPGLLFLKLDLSLIHIWRCRRSTLCRSRWSPYH